VNRGFAVETAGLNPRQAIAVVAQVVARRDRDPDCAAVASELRALLAERPARPVLRVACFGGFRIFAPEDPATTHEPRRGREFIQYLVLHARRTASRERLAELFWPDLPPEVVKHRVHMAASSARNFLRQILQGFDAIRCTAEGYCWHPAMQVESDVDRFAALYHAGSPPAIREAVTLYAGELLEGEHGDWLAPTRVKYATMYASMLEKLALLAYEQRDFERALDYGQDLLALDRAHESAARLVMRCFDLLGRRGRAVAEYRALRDYLRRHLGSEPMPETTAVIRRIVGAATSPGRELAHLMTTTRQ
jgi:DNA-binding SARP family transcriptional activator